MRPCWVLILRLRRNGGACQLGFLNPVAFRKYDSARSHRNLERTKPQPDQFLRGDRCARVAHLSLGRSDRSGLQAGCDWPAAPLLAPMEAESRSPPENG